MKLDLIQVIHKIEAIVKSSVPFNNKICNVAWK